MFRRFSFIALPMVCALLLTASAAPAAEDFLKLVPDSALGFVVINRPDAADAKLQALGRYIQLPMPGILTMLKQRSGIQEGWDQSGTLALLVLPPEGDGAVPTPILLIPVTDYGKFVGQLNAEDAAQPVTKIEIFQKAHLGPPRRRLCGADRRVAPPGPREDMDALQRTSRPSWRLAKMVDGEGYRRRDFAAGDRRGLGQSPSRAFKP